MYPLCAWDTVFLLCAWDTVFPPYAWGCLNYANASFNSCKTFSSFYSYRNLSHFHAKRTCEGCVSNPGGRLALEMARLITRPAFARVGKYSLSFQTVAACWCPIWISDNWTFWKDRHQCQQKDSCLFKRDTRVLRIDCYKTNVGWTVFMF